MTLFSETIFWSRKFGDWYSTYPVLSKSKRLANEPIVLPPTLTPTLTELPRPVTPCPITLNLPIRYHDDLEPQSKCENCKACFAASVQLKSCEHSDVSKRIGATSTSTVFYHASKPPLNRSVRQQFPIDTPETLYLHQPPQRELSNYKILTSSKVLKRGAK